MGLDALLDPSVQALLHGLVHGSQGMPNALSAPTAVGPDLPSTGLAMSNAPTLAGAPSGLRDTPQPASSPVASDPTTPTPSVAGGMLAAPDPSYGPVPNPAPGSFSGDPEDAISSLLGSIFQQQPTGPLPVSLRDQAAAKYQQAQDLQNAPMAHPAFRTADLLGLIPALLGGPNAGANVGAFLQGKEQYAQQDQQYQQAGIDRQRALLGQQAQGLTQAANTQDLIQGRQTVADSNNATKLDVQNAKTAGMLASVAQKGKTAVEVAQDRVAGIKAVADIAAKSRDFAGLLKQASGPSPTLRGQALDALRTQYPDYFAGTTDQDVKNIAQATDKELLQRAQAQKAVSDAKRAVASAGYLGAQTTLLQQKAVTNPAQLQAQLKQTLAKTDGINAATNKALADASLDESRSNMIRQQTSLLEPEFRLKYAQTQAQIAKYDDQAASGQVSNQAQANARNALQTQANIAKQQIDRIVKANQNQPPPPPDPNDPSSVPSPDYLTYQFAVKAQSDALRNIQKLTAAQRSTAMTPVTQSRPQVTLPSFPAATLNGQQVPTSPVNMNGPIGGGAVGQTRSGTRYRVVK